MAARENPNTQAINSILDEYRGIRKRSRRDSQNARRRNAKRPISSSIPSLNPILSHYKELGIDPSDFREKP